MVQFKPWKTFINRTLYSPKKTLLDFFPLWNPYNFCGAPLMANLQTQVFYPFSIVFYLLTDFVTAFKIFIVLHYFISAVFMFVLLKSKKLSLISCLMGSIVWSFNGFMVSRIEFLSVFSTAIWLPLLVYLVDIFSQKFRMKSVFILSFVIALQFLAGHAQVWFYSIMFLFFYSIFLSIKWKHFVPLFIFLGSVVGSILISAIQFIPTIEFFYNSTRIGEGLKDISNFGLGFEDSALHSLKLKDLSNFFYPFYWRFPELHNFISEILKVKHYWLYTFYIGFLAMTLSIIGFFNIKPLEEKLFFLTVFITAILYSLGKNFILFKILYQYLPFIRVFRHPAAGIYIPVFILCLLACYGVEWIKPTVGNDKKFKIRCAISLVIPLVVFLELYFYKEEISMLLPKSILYEKSSVIDSLLSQENVANYRFALTPSTIKLGSEEIIGRDLYDGFSKYRDRLFGNVNLEYQLYNFFGQDITLKKYREFLDFVYSRENLDLALPFFSIANVKYILSIKKQNTKNVKLLKDGDIKIYENLRVLPRVYFVTKAIYEKSIKESIKMLESMKDNILNIVIIHTKNELSNPSLSEKPSYVVKSMNFSDSRVDFEIHTETSGFVVISQNFYPGWKCKVNNSKTKIYPANIFMMAISINKGKNTIELVYEPLSFKVGAIITLTTFLLMFFYAVLSKPFSTRSTT